MTCKVIPTISEAESPPGGSGSQGSNSPSQPDADSHFEQLMISILEERDRLLDMLRETQETLALTRGTCTRLVRKTFLAEAAQYHDSTGMDDFPLQVFV